MIADPDVARAIGFLRGSKYGNRSALLRVLRRDGALDLDVATALSRAFGPPRSLLGLKTSLDFRLRLVMRRLPGRPSQRTKQIKDRQDFFATFHRSDQLVLEPPGRLSPLECEIEMRRQFAGLVARSTTDAELRSAIAVILEASGADNLRLEVIPFGRQRGRPKQRIEYRDALIDHNVELEKSKMRAADVAQGIERRALVRDAVTEVGTQMQLGDEVIRKSRQRRSRIKKV